MRIFYDSVTASDIPVSVGGVPIDGVLGYVDGRYAWSEADWARFHPSTVRVRIAIEPTTVADVLDVESGNPSTPADAVSWLKLCLVSGISRPTIYCSLSNVQAICNAMVGHGLPIIDFDVADWGKGLHVVTLPSERCPITQYASPETGSGGHYDLNVVSDDSWHPASSVVPAPVPVPVPSPVPVPVPVADPLEVAMMSFPVLESGSVGTNVRKAQGLLNAFGYGLTEDGSFGPKTEAATLGFQKGHGLAVDGRFGPDTLRVSLTA